VGVILFELVTGKPPFEQHSTRDELFSKIVNIKAKIPGWVSSALKELIEGVTVIA
jgi:serine/threonine protein kinase